MGGEVSVRAGRTVDPAGPARQRHVGMATTHGVDFTDLFTTTIFWHEIGSHLALTGSVFFLPQVCSMWMDMKWNRRPFSIFPQRPYGPAVAWVCTHMTVRGLKGAVTPGDRLRES